MTKKPLTDEQRAEWRFFNFGFEYTTTNKYQRFSSLFLTASIDVFSIHVPFLALTILKTLVVLISNNIISLYRDQCLKQHVFMQERFSGTDGLVTPVLHFNDKSPIFRGRSAENGFFSLNMGGMLLKYGDIAKELCGIARELTDLAERLSKIEVATPEINLASGADQPQKTMLSVEEAGEMLGVSRKLAYQLARRDHFPCLRIGRRILVPRIRLIEWVDNHCGQEVIL